MPKILLVHPHAESLADGIVTHCSTLYNMFRGSDDVEVLPPQNYPYRKIKLFNGLFKFGKLLEAVRQSGADIVHVHGYTTLQVGQALLAAVLCKKKIVYSPHWHPFHELRRPFLAKLFFYVTIAPLVRRFAACCVGINREDSTFLGKLGRPVFTIPHCLAELPPATVKRQEDNDRMSLLFVGRFDAANKGVDYLWHLPEGEYDIHLVGNGDIEPRSDMHIHRNVPTDELFQLYRSCSLVVVPSQYEAFSLVALEALSVGTPVVMSDKVRIADYLEGFGGISIFSYGDYDGFVSAVKESRKLKVDVTRVCSIFSQEAIRSQYANLYSSVLS